MIFETFFGMLGNDERIQFTVTRKGGRLSVLVQPALRGGVDDKAPEHIQTLRGALAMPLYVETSPAVLDRDFPRSLAEFAGTRDTIRNDLQDALDRLKEAGKQARVATDNATSAAQASSGTRANEGAADSAPAQSNVAVSVTEKSLF